MITKKKLKTKFDYQVRTFFACVLLLFVFTVIFVNPQIDNEKATNNQLNEEMRKEEDLNNRLQYEKEELYYKGTIKKDN